MFKTKIVATILASIATVAIFAITQPLAAADRTVKIAGWGAKSGPLRSFGVNSEAVLKAAVQSINDSGGVKLADGTMAMMEYEYHDSACNADQAISVARKVESQSEALIGIGPTCSGAAADRTVKIAGWGAKSGPLRSFGVNSEAVLKAAVQLSLIHI